MLYSQSQKHCTWCCRIWNAENGVSIDLNAAICYWQDSKYVWFMAIKPKRKRNGMNKHDQYYSMNEIYLNEGSVWFGLNRPIVDAQNGQNYWKMISDSSTKIFRATILTLVICFWYRPENRCRLNWLTIWCITHRMLISSSIKSNVPLCRIL